MLTIRDIVVLTVAVLPLAVVTVWILARRRSGSFAWRRSLAEVGIVYGTAPWVWMILTPNGGSNGDRRRVNLVPLHDLVEVVAAGPFTATVQIVGNLLVFAAVGFFAPIRFAWAASLRRI